jgi:pyridoxine 4-dehydrogenase
MHSGTFSLGGELSVNRLGFGTMRLTGPGIWGEPANRPAAIAVLRRAAELGINFIDTANSYGPYVAEELIREALHPYPPGLVIATKAGLVRTGPNKWTPVGRAEYLRQECEMSLRRLRLERIDPKVPADEQFGVLKDLQDEGKIRFVGLSEVGIAEIEAARKIVPMVSVQNMYNITERKYENVLHYCEREKLGFIPWFPLATGNLAKTGSALDRVAHKLGAQPGQVALAWLLKKSPVMLPIPGTSSVKHLEENTAAGSLELDEATFDELDKLSKKAGAA